MRRVSLIVLIVLLSQIIRAQCALSLVPSVSPSNVCNPCNGNVSVVPSGGNAPYMYSWTGGYTDQFVDSLCPGTYTVLVTDQLGCTQADTLVVANGNTLTVSAAIVTGILCNGDSTGELIANFTGGNGPYTFLWSGGETTQTITGKPAGCYNVIVTEASGCLDTDTVCLFQPSALNMFSTGNNDQCELCIGSAAAIGGGGTPPYTYTWSSSQTTTTINNLCQGIYTIVLTDNNGCILTQSVAISTTPAPIVNPVQVTPASCFSCCDGELTANPAGGSSPYTYLWSPGGATTQSVSALCMGTYTVCVTDANGCSRCDTIAVNTTVGINKHSDNQLQINPNPTSGPVFLTLDDVNQNSVVRIIDSSGRELYRNSFSPELELSFLPGGVYTLECLSGKQLVRRRLVISKI